MIQVGRAWIKGLEGASVVMVNGGISPNIGTLRLTHDVTIDRIRGQAGPVTGILGVDDAVECQFDFVPEGASSTAARTSAGLPTAPAIVTISGLPVVTIGSFADVFNSGAWIYEGGGQINGTQEGKWTATVTLRRYVGIPNPTIIP